MMRTKSVGTNHKYKGPKQLYIPTMRRRRGESEEEEEGKVVSAGYYFGGNRFYLSRNFHVALLDTKQRLCLNYSHHHDAIV